MAAVNPWEREARRKKTAKLTAHITELVTWCGLDPKTDGYLIADLLRGWGDAEWVSAAINVGSSGVSVATRLAVIAHFGNAQLKKESA